MSALGNLPSNYKETEARAFKEAEQIYSKESTRRGRNIAEIAEACMFGHAPEIWMMTNGGYVDDTRKYKNQRKSKAKFCFVKKVSVFCK